MAKNTYAVPTAENSVSMISAISRMLVPRRCGRRCEGASGRNMTAVSGRVRVQGPNGCRGGRPWALQVDDRGRLPRRAAPGVVRPQPDLDPGDADLRRPGRA